MHHPESNDKDIEQQMGLMYRAKPYETIFATVFLIFEFDDLDVSNDNIEDAGAIILSRNTSLFMLEINNDKLSPIGIAALAKIKNLQYLSANDNHGNDSGAKALALNKNVNVIYLNNNNIGDEGAIALSSNNNLQYLELDNNHITDKGAIAFANVPLFYLSLSYNNQISDAGAQALANNQDIYFLYLDHANIHDPGAIAFAESGGSLNSLDVSYNHISSYGISALKNSGIPYLNVEGNTPEGSKTANRIDEQKNQLKQQKILQLLHSKT